MSLSDRMIERDGECNYNLDLATDCLTWIEKRLELLRTTGQINAIEIVAIEKHIHDTQRAIEDPA